MTDDASGASSDPHARPRAVQRRRLLARPRSIGNRVAFYYWGRRGGRGASVAGLDPGRGGAAAPTARQSTWRRGGRTVGAREAGGTPAAGRRVRDGTISGAPRAGARVAGRSAAARVPRG